MRLHGRQGIWLALEGGGITDATVTVTFLKAAGPHLKKSECRTLSLVSANASCSFSTLNAISSELSASELVSECD